MLEVLIDNKADFEQNWTKLLLVERCEQYVLF